ncbi:GD15846 [Drosophila simulans]|uniref:GD15846 n=1 Tax=Drosophila simulans TaxID=7240 RepID=B4R4V0_DROSI|nr:GD15846 [Drosophila simulans]
MIRGILLLLLGTTGFSLIQCISNDVYFKMFSQQAPPDDPCYNKAHEPRACIPDFVNAAYDAPVVASSTCGSSGAQRYCEYQDHERSCHTCDMADPLRSFPARSLTDLNNSNNVTCWRSEPVTGSGDNVTLTLSLGKKFELTYVILQLCPHAPRPDSMVIYKSTDHGLSWQPFQFFSSQCRRLFGRPARQSTGRHNEHEARCSDVTRPLVSRIAFSTLEGRPSSRDLDSSPVLQDWVTATDIRVVFHRLQRPDPQALLSLEAGGAADLASGKYSVPLTNGPAGNNIEANLGGDVATSGSGLHYAISDFSVGGRCKCNGHASKCSTDASGQLNCECSHNTAGRDCERCKPFHFDRPWARATAKEANECKECGKCRVSTKRLNLNKFCKRDYAIMAKVIGRDTSSEAVSREAQRRAMDPDVADYEMDQVQPGSARSPITGEYEFQAADYPNPNPRGSEMERFDLQIQAVFKRSRPGESSGAGNVYGMPNTTLKRGPMTWIIPTKDLECRCPKIRVNRSYLILGRDSEAPPGYLGIGPHSIVIEWKEDWYRRMKRFQRRARTCA